MNPILDPGSPRNAPAGSALGITPAPKSLAPVESSWRERLAAALAAGGVLAIAYLYWSA